MPEAASPEASALYCFSCGRSVPPGQPVPFCAACATAGPHLERARVRWLLRGAEGLPRRSMAHADVADLLMRNALPDETEASREGGPWLPLAAHPDFRAYFLPGSAASAGLQAKREARTETARGRTSRGRRRLVAAAALMVGSLALAGVAYKSRLFTISEEAAAQIEAGAQQATDAAQQAAEGAAPPAELPGAALVQRLQAAAAGRDQGIPWLLQVGRAGLWQGTAAGAAASREALEAAVGLSPDDPEALGALVEAYAALGDPAGSMGDALQRAAALAPDAVATQRARAAASLAWGDPQKAAAAAEGCAAEDPGCALLLARAKRDGAGLQALLKRYPAAGAVRFAQAEAALAGQRWGEAAALATALTRSYPKEPGAWSHLALASAAVGDWKKALSASERAGRLDPDHIASRHLHARILLRVRGDGAAPNPQRARAELEKLTAHPGFAAFAGRRQVYLDLAEADVRSGEPARALERTAAALEIAPADPAALLLRAWAGHLQGDARAAEEALHRLEAGALAGRDAGHVHLGAARVYLALGQHRAAHTELQSALQADASSVDAWLESARAELAAGDPMAAIESVEAAPLRDGGRAANRDPLAAPWIPPPDWGKLRSDLAAALAGDARYAKRERALQGIVAWWAGDRDADALLSAAVAEDGSAPAAAALAQLRLAQGRLPAAAALLERVVAAEPNNASFLAMQAHVLASSRDPAARALLDRAAGLEPASPAVLYWRAQALRALGDGGARQAFEDLLRIDADDLRAREALGSF